jgi:hypothetical protein
VKNHKLRLGVVIGDITLKYPFFPYNLPCAYAILSQKLSPSSLLLEKQINELWLGELEHRRAQEHAWHVVSKW